MRYTTLFAALILCFSLEAQFSESFFSITTGIGGPKDVHLVDLDADGDIDAIGAIENGDKVSWFENDGSGSFSQAGEHVLSAEMDGARGVTSADIDLDGDPDVIAVSYLDDKVVWFENLGAGEFATASVVSTALDGPSRLETGDLDGDGDQDIVAISWYDHQVAWFPNDGAGNFSDKIVIFQGEQPFGCVDVFDYDNDGDLDVFSDAFGAELLKYENQGLGVFAAPETITGDVQGLSWISHIDIDADGDLDLFYTDLIQNSVFWNEMLDNGEFGPLQTINNDAMGAAYVQFGDIDADGDFDVLSASINDNKVVWYENLGNALFGPQQLVDTPFQFPKFAELQDIDGDGDGDYVSSTAGRIIWYENIGNEGCMDASACNYDPAAQVDSEDCCYSECGCPVAGAQNFDPLATCDDGSCLFQIVGQVFFDENEDGIFNGDEMGLPLQEVLIHPSNALLYSNNEGLILANLQGSEDHSIILLPDSLYPFHTTAWSYLLEDENTDWTDTLYFGISNEAPDYELDITLYPTVDAYPCDEPVMYNICARNTGNSVIDMQISIDYDSLFAFNSATIPVDSMDTSVLYLSQSDMQPGEIRCFLIELQTPTVDFIGTMLGVSVEALGFVGAEQVAFGGASVVNELACAYDPNDKQVFPIGYSDAHYIPEEDYLEYLIRFQNTGNAPATDVIIRDTLDVGLDLSTFELVANSHSVFTTVDPDTREIEFYFQDIQLPDSVNNEPESHGFVSFKIRPEQGLPLLTELNNTAGIYFDNNPPIITNTTWSTLYDCSLFEVSFTQDGAILTASEGDSYQWYLDGEPIDGATAPIFEVFETGDYTVEVGIDFPCSAVSEGLFIEVEEPSTYIPLLGENKRWGHAVFDFEGCNGAGDFYCQFTNLEFIQDTVIGAIEYQYLGEGLYEYQAILREDIQEKKVFWNVDGTEYLIYDFDVHIGDELTVTDFVNGELELVVQNIDSITTVDGHLRRRYFMSGVANPIWVEGIGNINQGLLYQSEGAGTGPALLCFTENDLILIDENCGALGIDEFTNSPIGLFPNPMTTTAIIDLSELQGNFTLELYDITGKLLRSEQQTSSNQQLTLNRGDLTSGQYLLRIVQEGTSYDLPFVVD